MGFLMMRRYPGTSRGLTGSRKGQASAWASISIKMILKITQRETLVTTRYTKQKLSVQQITDLLFPDQNKERLQKPGLNARAASLTARKL